MTEQDLLSGSWEGLHGLMVMITCMWRFVLFDCVQKAAVSLSKTERWTAAEQLLIRQGNWHFYRRCLLRRKKNSDAWIRGIHAHTHTQTVPSWSASFLDQKAFTVLPYSMRFVCASWGSPSLSVSLLFSDWDDRSQYTLTARTKFILKKGLQYHSTLKSPSKPAPWENLDLEIQRDLKTPYTAIYGCSWFMISWN